MRILISLVTIILMALSIGCSKDSELKKSVFIPDTIYPDLPAYSEWGYNTFGAFIDRKVFKSSDAIVPAKIIINDGKFVFQLGGSFSDSYFGDGNYNLTLKFYLPVSLPVQYADLVDLDNDTISLKEPGSKVIFKNESNADTVKVIGGYVYFKRVQKLYVDDEMNEVILSGYFMIQMLVNDEPVSVSEGRFDVGIGEDNFFSYK
jgi:hypothetical protein